MPSRVLKKVVERPCKGKSVAQRRNRLDGKAPSIFFSGLLEPEDLPERLLKGCPLLLVEAFQHLVLEISAA